MKTTLTKHMITITESRDFSSLIKKYEDWSGQTVTESQRDRIFRSLVEEGLQDRVLNLIAGDGLNQVAIDALTDEGTKNLKPSLY